jgi:hypothetical protein
MALLFHHCLLVSYWKQIVYFMPRLSNIYWWHRFQYYNIVIIYGSKFRDGAFFVVVSNITLSLLSPKLYMVACNKCDLLNLLQWNLELRTQSLPGESLTFELNFPIWNNVNSDSQNICNIKNFKCLFQKIILVNNDKTKIFNVNNWMFLFIIVHT